MVLKIYFMSPVSESPNLFSRLDFVASPMRVRATNRSQLNSGLGRIEPLLSTKIKFSSSGAINFISLNPGNF